ncbi:DUF6577 family protein [uncultured Selenomonas sp.]|uniref:DUF6577 family protein n=1 Tax=uncultured Selenomonas sp. TaxID=159275 RepID=UPI0025EFBBEB|nr:DUF6577 family protein [uncultured Selenomonas sp.]
MEAAFLGQLQGRSWFSREELSSAMEAVGLHLGAANFKSKLQKLLVEGRIARAGRNAYYVPQEGVRPYTYEASPLACEIAGILQAAFPFADFTIFELVQLNEFVNHQLAHNVFFVDADGDTLDFVFDTLKENYPGKVLLRPSVKTYHTYWTNDMIVLQRLVTEAPREKKQRWQGRLEKILVDLAASSLMRSIVSPSEYPAIYEGAFERYVIDESTLFRYAKRRGTEQRLRTFLAEETGIRLRLEQPC